MSNEKPPRRKSWKSGTIRDIEAERRLKTERAASRSELSERAASRAEQDALAEADTAPQGTPEHIDQIDTGMTQSIADSPDLHRLFVRSEHNRELIQEARKDAANLVIDALGKVPPAEHMSKLEKMIRRIRWVVIAVAIPAGSSAILVGRYIYNRAVESTRQGVLVERMVDREKEYELKINKLEEEVRAALELSRQNTKRIDDIRGEVNFRSGAVRRDP